MVQGQPIKLKTDTGAGERVLSAISFFRQYHQHHAALSEAHRHPYGPDGARLAARSVAQLKLSYRDRTTVEEVHVMDEVHTSLLAKPTIRDLKMLTFVNVVKNDVDLKEGFPWLFQGLRKLKRQQHIHLLAGAQSSALSCPRRIPIPVYEIT